MTNESAVKTQSETQRLRGRPVTNAEAQESAKRFIDEHFRNDYRGMKRVQTRIPADVTDDDLLLIDYLLEAESFETHVTTLSAALAKLVRLCIVQNEDTDGYVICMGCGLRCDPQEYETYGIEHERYEGFVCPVDEAQTALAKARGE